MATRIDDALRGQGSIVWSTPARVQVHRPVCKRWLLLSDLRQVCDSGQAELQLLSRPGGCLVLLQSSPDSRGCPSAAEHQNLDWNDVPASVYALPTQAVPT